MVDDLRFGVLAEFESEHYARRVLGEVSGVEIVVVGWGTGQQTTIHDHAGSLCAYKVLRGRLIEEKYEAVDGPRRADMELAPGWIQGCGMEQVHRLRNDGPPAVSLHLYTPPFDGGAKG
jgi:cysteine dioxygenase